MKCTNCLHPMQLLRVVVREDFSRSRCDSLIKGKYGIATNSIEH